MVNKDKPFKTAIHKIYSNKLLEEFKDYRPPYRAKICSCMCHDPEIGDISHIDACCRWAYEKYRIPKIGEHVNVIYENEPIKVSDVVIDNRAFDPFVILDEDNNIIRISDIVW